MTYLETGNLISANETGNSTQVLLGISATYTGVWEDVTRYTTGAVAILGTLATATGTLYVDLSTNGGTTFTSIPFVIGNITFDLPHVINLIETHFRIRYVNDAVAQTGTFSIQTKYSNGQELGLNHSMGSVITSTAEGQIVKSVVSGETPSNGYVNAALTGHDDGNSSLVALGIGAEFTGVWVDVSRFHGTTVSVSGTVAGETGTLHMEYSHDGITADEGLGTDSFVDDLTHTTPRTTGVVSQYFRVRYTNGGVAQTTFSIQTILQTQRIDLTATTSQILHDAEDVRLVRTVSEHNEERNIGLLEHQSSKRKFGINEAVGIAAFEPINPSGAYTFPTTAETLRIRAGGNAADTSAGLGATRIQVTFLDSTFTEVTETIITTGAAASAATTSTAIRLLSAKVINAGTYHGANIGDIIIEQSTSAIALGEIPAESGTTEQSIYTVPAGFTMYITEIFVSVGQADSADVVLYKVSSADDVATPFGSKQKEWSIEDYAGADMFKLDTYLKFDAKSDVWFEAKRITGNGSARVSVDFNFYLVHNQI